jgi:hypothetical protein
MYYRIENHAGGLVYETTPTKTDQADAIVFESNGDYTKDITIDITDEVDISKHLDKKPEEEMIASLEQQEQAKEKADANKYVESYKAKSKKDGEQDFKPTAIIAELTREKISIYKFASKSGFNLRKGQKIMDEEDYTEGRTFKTGDIDKYQRTYNIEIEINEKPDFGETVMIYMPQKRPEIKSPWESGDPANWKITFTLYDANKYGAPTEQITVSPNGVEQKKTKSFKVIKEGEEIIDGEEQTTQPSPPTPTSILTPTQISNLLKNPKLAFLGETCGSGYSSKLMFTDNNDNWAHAYNEAVVNDKEWLNLCISDDLITAYDRNVIHFKQRPDQNNPCGSDYDNEGWINNQGFTTWAKIGTNEYGPRDYLHLCVSKKAKQDLGRFVYFGHSPTADNCPAEFNSNGDFRFIWEGNFPSLPKEIVGWEFAKVYSPDGNPIVLSNRLEFIRWVSLCAKKPTSLSGAH